MASRALALGDLGTNFPLEIVEMILRNVGDKPNRLTHKQIHDLNAPRRTNKATNEFVEGWIIMQIKRIKTFPSAATALEDMSDVQIKAIEPPGSPRFVPNDALSEAVIEDCPSCVDGICNILEIPRPDRPNLCNEQGWSLLSLSIDSAETYRSLRLINCGLFGDI
ncbi:hypothetical protein AAEP93_003093 [Penicillium crustosum]